MQRLTKYALLLKVIERKSDSDAEKQAIIDMIRHVERFVGHVNSTLRRRQEQDRLTSIAARIDCYDAFEGLKNMDDVDKVTL